MKVLGVAALLLVIGWLLGYFKELMDPPLWISLALTWMLACLFLGIGGLAKWMGGGR